VHPYTPYLESAKRIQKKKESNQIKSNQIKSNQIAERKKKKIERTFDTEYMSLVKPRGTSFSMPFMSLIFIANLMVITVF